MRAVAVALNAKDYAIIVLAAAFALAGIALALVMMKLFQVVASLRELVDGVTKETVPLIHDVDQTVKGVNNEIERVDSIMASTQSVVKNVETISETVKVTVTNPLVKALAFLAGARRASKKFREG
jgi:predicted PurR-regulated permease PerM